MDIAFYKLVVEEDKPALLKLKEIKSTDTIYGTILRLLLIGVVVLYT